MEYRIVDDAGQDILDARGAADAIGIPHYVLDYESRFGEAVIEDFADSYARGETPNPCVRCNDHVKYAWLLDRARIFMKNAGTIIVAVSLALWVLGFLVGGVEAGSRRRWYGRW